MQQELHRLERMMVLVSEALQKKDHDQHAGINPDIPRIHHSDELKSPQHTHTHTNETG